MNGIEAKGEGRHARALLRAERDVPPPGTAETAAAASAGPDPGRARRLEADLANPMTWSMVDAAVRWTGDGPARPYAVLLGPEYIRVRLTGVEPGDPPPPWRAVDGGWAVDRRTLGAIPVPPVSARSGRARPGAGYVAIGSRGDEIVLLDLDAAPGAVSVTGDPQAAAKFISALIAQVGASGGYRVVDGLELVPDTAADEVPVLLVHWRPSARDLADLDAMLAADPRLRALVHGELPGPRWPFTVDADGTLASAPLGLTAAAAGLPTVVAQRPAPPPLGPAAGVRAGLWPAPPAPAPLSASIPIPAPVPAPQPVSQPLPPRPVPAAAIPDPGLAALPPRDARLGLEPFTAPREDAS